MSVSSKQEPLITRQEKFEELCAEIRQEGIVAFDSEFVSERTYRADLCLLQFATSDRLVGVDPLQLDDLSLWWELMADPEVAVIVHGGQAEIRFCLHESEQRPQNLLDVQLAEGFRGRSYPLGHHALIERVLGHRLAGKETRTDWRRRPLSAKQIRYALADVADLMAVWEVQQADLAQRGRLDWVRTEMRRLIDDVQAERSRPPWSRLSGIHRLRRRELAAAMELAQWRQERAEQVNKPPRWILRDDLVIELARRQPASRDELAATRDMNRGDYRRRYDDILACLQRAREQPVESLPSPVPNERADSKRDEHILGQLLGIALASRCAEEQIARSIVATSADLRQLVRWHLFDQRQGPAPKLAQGWRAELCGELLEEMMDGKIAMRVADPSSDHPLVFEREPN